MKLKRCYIENFGKLQQFEYEFSEGLNVINKLNGWGKTTFATFIKAMFYGFDTSNKRAISENERRKYYPWQGGKFGGNLEFEINGEIYEIERFFGIKDKEDTFKLYNKATNCESNAYSSNIGEEIFKIDRQAYERSTYISGQEISVEINDSLSAKLSNILESDNDINSSEEAIERITTIMKEYKKTGNKGQINEIETRKETLRERRKREKEEARRKAMEIDENQLTINLNGLEENKKIKKYNHDKDELVPLGLENEQFKPNVIESNLFKQEVETKEEKVKEVLNLEHTIAVEEENYEFPPVELLSEGESKGPKGGKKAVTDTATKLQKTLYSFGVSAKVENVSVGPAITRYELKPAEGVRVSKIANLADDIALNLAAETIRIEAPIPGKQAVGIEVPNKENEVVHFRDIIDTDEFRNHKSKLAFALGKDVAGKEIVTDIAKMPHVMIAGATGSGKSVCINTLISSIIYKAKPSEVKLVMVDPKVVELSVYNGIPHLLIPVVTDPRKAAGALAWAVQEMENRYNAFAEKGVRDLKGYNEAIKNEEGIGRLPHIIIIIDELADLMMVAKNDVEDAICRLAQKARAAGMHLVIATQRPSVDVITGLIKANIPSRIAFAVSSQVDSRTILDMVGAEKLLGKGDMLFYPAGAPKPTRVQGAFVSDGEVEKIVDFVKANGEVTYNEDILESIENSNKSDKEMMEEASEDETDPFLMDAIEVVVETGQASTSFIQRRFKVGYARAGRIVDQMEERGIISGYQGSKPREVLMTKERWAELKMGTTQVSSPAEPTSEVAKAMDTIKKIGALNSNQEEY